jgi:hypothetical protein
MKIDHLGGQFSSGQVFLPKNLDRRTPTAAVIFSGGCCIKTSARLEIGFVVGNSLTGHRDSRCIRTGARDRCRAMRDEFASKGFLAVTIAGVALLCSGLVAFVFT